MKVCIVPVAAGRAAAAGPAITGASLTSAETTAVPSAADTAHGQAPKSMAGEGATQATPPSSASTKRMVICLVLV